MLGGRVQITSRGRTEDHNREVGGVSNSRHLFSRGARARDFIPPRGMPRGRRGVQWIRQQFAALGINLVEALDEGDHFHIAW